MKNTFAVTVNMGSAEELAAYINAVGHLVQSINVVTTPVERAAAGPGPGRPPRGSKVNDAILSALQSGPRTAKDLRDALGEAGLAPGSLSTGLAILQRAHAVKRLGDGLYGLAALQEAAE